MSSIKLPDIGIVSGIYGIRNSLRDKWYIGSGVDIRRRWRRHLYDLSNNRHNSKFQNSWNKNSSDIWEFYVLEECQVDKKILEDRENYWIQLKNSYHNGYNGTERAYTVLGHTHSLISRKKMSNSHVGVPLSKERIEAIRDRMLGNKYGLGNKNALGFKWSEETKKKFSDIKTGSKYSDEHKLAISRATKGKKKPPRTEEHRRKLKEAWVRRKMNKEKVS